MELPMLQITDLHLSIAGHKILEGVQLSVKSGEQVGMIGPNGSGKTTLFNAISGFLTPQRGTVELAERNVTYLSPALRAQQGLGRVFQNFGIFRDLTVLENMLVALESRAGRYSAPWGAGARARRLAAMDALGTVGLAEKAEQRAQSLSGGQMRLLEIGRLLLFGANLFLLDEPTAGVSPRMKGEIEKMFRNLRAQGKTCIVIEHDITFIERLCDRVVVLEGGQVVLDGAPDVVRRDPRLQEIYFGAPASS